MQSSNIAIVATLFIFAAVFAQAAYSLNFEAPDRSKRLFWVDKKSDANSEPEKRLFWVDKKSPEKRLFWVDKKSPEKRLFWVDKKSADATPEDLQKIDQLADCFVRVFSGYMDHVSACNNAGMEHLKECKQAVDKERSINNYKCMANPGHGAE